MNRLTATMISGVFITTLLAHAAFAGDMNIDKALVKQSIPAQNFNKPAPHFSPVPATVLFSQARAHMKACNKAHTLDPDLQTTCEYG